MNLEEWNKLHDTTMEQLKSLDERTNEIYKLKMQLEDAKVAHNAGYAKAMTEVTNLLKNHVDKKRIIAIANKDHDSICRLASLLNSYLPEHSDFDSRLQFAKQAVYLNPEETDTPEQLILLLVAYCHSVAAEANKKQYKKMWQECMTRAINKEQQEMAERNKISKDYISKNFDKDNMFVKGREEAYLVLVEILKRIRTNESIVDWDLPNELKEQLDLIRRNVPVISDVNFSKGIEKGIELMNQKINQNANGFQVYLNSCDIHNTDFSKMPYKEANSLMEMIYEKFKSKLP